MRKTVSLFFICLVLIFIVPTHAFAGSDYNNLASKEKKICKRAWEYLRLETKGGKEGKKPSFTEEATAGVLGNIDQETGFKDSHGSHHSYIQMDGDVWAGFVAWADDHNLDTKDIAVQLRYAWGNIRDKSWNEYVSAPKLSDWYKADNITLGMEGFMVSFERCVGGSYSLQKVTRKGGKRGYQDGGLRMQYAKSIYKALKGTVSSGSDSSSSSKSDSKSKKGEESQAQVIANLKVVGAYSESDLEEFTKLNEIPVETKYLAGADRGTLKQTQVTGLSDWEDNVKLLSGDSGIVRLLRIIIVGIGICMIVWSLFIYTGYWFDRINVFIDIDLLGILTFGRLHKSDNEAECTFQLKNFGRTDTMTVNHRAVLEICILGTVFGVSIVSGLMFRILSNFINGIIRFFGG